MLTGTKLLFCCLLEILLLILRYYKKNSFIYLYTVSTPVYTYFQKYNAYFLVLKVTSLSAKPLSNILQRVTIFIESVYCTLFMYVCNICTYVCMCEGVYVYT